MPQDFPVEPDISPGKYLPFLAAVQGHAGSPVELRVRATTAAARCHYLGRDGTDLAVFAKKIYRMRFIGTLPMYAVMQATEQTLFTAVNVGKVSLSHRVVMAPLTRLRSDQPGDMPNDLMAEYYGQRASQGGTDHCRSNTGCRHRTRISGRAPGSTNDEQIAGWRKVTDAVHAKGGRIFLQLWHVGRQSHVELTGGLAPVAPSVVPFDEVVYTSQGWIPASPHRALPDR